MEKVVEELKKIPEIKKVFALTGDYDVLAELDVESTDELYSIFSRKIDMITGITNTNTHIVMKAYEK